VKIRGTAHHIAEKYLQLARDAQTSGDPVTAENHFQHAEHYYRLIAAAQEQLRQQNPYYQPQAMPGEGNRDEAFDDGEDEGAGQPMQGQPSFGGQQRPIRLASSRSPTAASNRRNSRPQQQPYQQYQPQLQPAQPPQRRRSRRRRQRWRAAPSFITGTQPQQGLALGPNGHDNQGGDRFPRHRRRRHRGPGGPRNDMSNVPQDLSGDDGPDDSRPGNS
jgi:hypothetical protein